MSEPLRLHTTLHPRGPAAAVLLDDDQVARVGGGRKAFPVRVTLNGHTLRLRLARMGGENMIGFSKAARQEAGVEPGDEVEVEIALDDAPREVEVPVELSAALEGDPDARRAFEGLSFTHRKEYARWVAEAKKAETRERRIAETLERLKVT
jgi:Bacteriocin-protection, YdeI or OmpD-Associated/Domain of unknown function (DUF1905)